MSIEVLNTGVIRKVIKSRGWTLGWVITQIGEKPNFGYELLREGRLPKDQDRKSQVLRKLSNLLGVEVGELLLTLEAKKKTA